MNLVSREGVPLFLFLLLALAFPLSARAAEDPFDVISLAAPGRSVSVEIAELNGDARPDLLQVVFQGVSPDESRRIHIYFQEEDGGLPTEPSLDLPLPPGSGAFDIADVIDSPGAELLLLGPLGISILSFAGGVATEREALIPAGSTVAMAADERGLDRVTLVSFAGSEPRLIVPGLNEIFLLFPDGRVAARLEVRGRADYRVQAPGPIFVESDIQVSFAAPRISWGDVDGDGRVDLVSSNRDELRVFLQGSDGRFGDTPDRLVPLGLVSLQDHIRGSSSVRCLANDIDGDGRLDLVISHMSGGITQAKAEARVFINRNGGWDLEHPDAVFESRASASGDQLIDLDGDGRLELVRFGIPISVLEVVEIFLTRAVDVHLAVYGMGPGRKFDPNPRFRRKLDVPIDFETARPRGFMPTFDFDLNGDGHRDLLSSRDGSGLEIFLGSDATNYRKRVAHQRIATSGVVRAGDWNSDGFLDLVLSDPRLPDHPIRLLINRGILPGSPRIGGNAGTFPEDVNNSTNVRGRGVE